VAQIEIIREENHPQGWRFAAQWLDDAGTLHATRIDLAFADYDHWCPGGEIEPAHVATAVLRCLLNELGENAIRPRFDASIVRRMVPDADAKLPGYL
jgi:hypothetical protein